MSARRGKRLVSVGAAVVLLGAVLPNVLWLGHWNIPGLEVTSKAQAAHDHASHCHGNSSCVNEASYGLQWWSAREEALVLDSGLQRAEALEQAPSPSEPAVWPLDPPPRDA